MWLLGWIFLSQGFMLDISLFPSKSAFDHLSFGCGLFGISDGQSVAAQAQVILQDQSRLRGRAQLTRQQAET